MLAEEWGAAGNEKREGGGWEEEEVSGLRDHGILQTANHAKYFTKSLLK